MPKPSVSTRAVLATDTVWNLPGGVRAYQIAGDSYHQAILPESDFVAVYYEAVVLPEGAWWLPTSTVADRRWQGSNPLQATGAIPTANVLRAADFFLWVPREVDLEQYFAPITILGEIQGSLPKGPPPSGNPLP